MLIATVELTFTNGIASCEVDTDGKHILGSFALATMVNSSNVMVTCAYGNDNNKTVTIRAVDTNNGAVRLYAGTMRVNYAVFVY